MKNFIFTAVMCFTFSTTAFANQTTPKIEAVTQALEELSDLKISIVMGASSSSAFTLAEQVAEQALSSVYPGETTKMAQVLATEQNACVANYIVSLNQVIQKNLAHYNSIVPNLGKVKILVTAGFDKQFEQYMNVAFVDGKFVQEAAFAFKLDLFLEPVVQAQVFSYPTGSDDDAYYLSTIPNSADKKVSYGNSFFYGWFADSLEDAGIDPEKNLACQASAYGVSFLLGKSAEDVKNGYRIP